MRITALTGAGTTNVTVYYTNTIPGTNYVLLYSVDPGLTNWLTVGSKTAPGLGDFQTDPAADSGQRYYRVATVLGTPSVLAGLRITSVTGVGSGSVTVGYTNTVAGRNYVLAYNTNLSTTNWFPAGNKLATGPGDTQTDPTATSNRRYYRVFSPAP